MEVRKTDPGLSWAERWFALKCIFLLQAVSISIRWFGFNPVYSWLKRRGQGFSLQTENKPEFADQAAYVGALVGVANRRIPSLAVSCLPESMTVWWLLRRRGIASDLRLGIRRSDDRLDGHAWVEINSRVVSGDPNVAQDFIPLDALSGSQ